MCFLIAKIKKSQTLKKYEKQALMINRPLSIIKIHSKAGINACPLIDILLIVE